MDWTKYHHLHRSVVRRDGVGEPLYQTTVCFDWSDNVEVQVVSIAAWDTEEAMGVHRVQTPTRHVPGSTRTVAVWVEEVEELSHC